MKRVAQLFVSFLLAAGVSWAEDALDETLEKDTLVIVTSERACRSFDVYLARSYEQKRRGLMYVRDLPETIGMLFIYEDDDMRSMWMKNTYIPLDILFIRSDGSVANIAKNTEPLSLKSLGSIEPVSYVLELNAGVTDRYGIDENSRLLWDGLNGNDE